MASEIASTVVETNNSDVDMVAVENEVKKETAVKTWAEEVEAEEENEAEYIVKDEIAENDGEEGSNKANGDVKTEEKKEPDPEPEFQFADGDQGKCTLHVKNLPRYVVSKDLEAVFSDVGSVTGCFLVASSDQTKKGFGYVTFAQRETAEKAIEAIKAKGASKVFEEVSKKRKATDDGGKDAPPKKKANKKKANKKKANNKPAGESKPEGGDKSARVVIRNLKFGTKIDEIRKAFASFGEIKAIHYPKRRGFNHQIGFCFIQFEKFIDAKNAIEQMNGRDFMGRPLGVEWPRKVKNEPQEKSGDNKNAKKKDSKDSKKVEKKEPKKKAVKKKVADAKKPKDVTPEKESSVLEGRTLFLKNVPLDTTEQELYEVFCAFGQVQYAVICIDAYTESPTGTAVVEFVKKEDAEACLKKANGLAEDRGIRINDAKLEVRIAVNQDELELRKELKDRKYVKDPRNLHLAREGEIRPGTKAAEGVSASDMGKRLELQTWKNKKLKNLNMFVSDKRLCVRNIPLSMRNTGLRDMFLKAGGPGASLTEVFIMRDTDKTKDKADAPTKMFGFVTFTRHEHALAALRAVNNNPKFFSKEQRPIVEFSLENRAAVKAKGKDESGKRDDLKRRSNQDERSNRLGVSRDRLGANRDRSATNRNQLGANRDRLAASRDRLGGNRDRSALGHDRLGAYRDRSAIGRDPMGANRDRSAVGRDNFGANRDRSAVGRNRMGANRDRSAVGQDRMMANRDRMGADNRRMTASNNRQQQQRNRSSPVRNNRQDRRGDKSRDEEEEVEPRLVLDQIRKFIDATGILGLGSLDSNASKDARGQQRGRRGNRR